MRISRYNRPVVVVTMGYPAGIGPEIIIKALASQSIRRLANFLIIGDIGVFAKALPIAREKLRHIAIKTEGEIDFSKENILFLDMGNVSRKHFRFGAVSKKCGKASIDFIDKAVSLIKQKRADILVTAPIHKHAAAISGFKYSGHTEYLARLSGAKDYAMMLIGGVLKVVLVTTHLPLKEVARRLRARRISIILRLTGISLRKHFSIRRPRIAVCGLNPHAGDSGLLGDEEVRIIAPAIKAAREENIDAIGPHPADAVFYDVYKGHYDAVICMYHDQGLVALKMLARDKSVNVTLGLPFIRTSPGHGTALNIAGKGIASAESMKQAIKTAVKMHKAGEV